MQDNSSLQKKGSSEMLPPLKSGSKGRGQLTIQQTGLVTYEGKNTDKGLGSLGNINIEQTNSNMTQSGRGKTNESQGSLDLNSLSMARSVIPMPRFDTGFSTQDTSDGMRKLASPKTLQLENSLMNKGGKLFTSAKANSLPHDAAPVEGKNPSKSQQLTINTNTKQFFSNNSKLSVTEKFKRNLLDVVKDEEDDISPIISAQKRPLSKMPKPLEVQTQKIVSKETKRLSLERVSGIQRAALKQHIKGQKPLNKSQQNKS